MHNVSKFWGTCPLEFYERKFAEYSEEETRLESALVILNDRADEYQQLGVAIHELAYKSKPIFEKAGIEDRRLLLSQMVTNLFQNGVTISPNYTKAAQFLANWLPRLNQDYELHISRSIKGKTEDLTSASPVWRRVCTDVRTCFQAATTRFFIPSLSLNFAKIN